MNCSENKSDMFPVMVNICARVVTLIFIFIVCLFILYF